MQQIPAYAPPSQLSAAQRKLNAREARDGSCLTVGGWVRSAVSVAVDVSVAFSAKCALTTASCLCYDDVPACVVCCCSCCCDGGCDCSFGSEFDGSAVFPHPPTERQAFVIIALSGSRKCQTMVQFRISRFAGSRASLARLSHFSAREMATSPYSDRNCGEKTTASALVGRVRLRLEWLGHDAPNERAGVRRLGHPGRSIMAPLMSLDDLADGSEFE